MYNPFWVRYIFQILLWSFSNSVTHILNKYTTLLHSFTFLYMQLICLITIMFSNWLKLRRRRHEVSQATPNWSRRFSCSSFKDVHTLLHHDVPSPELQVLHRLRSLKIDRFTSRTPPPTTKTLVSTDHGGVVLYYTSLHIVRKTFEECRAVRAILQMLRIPIDERDLTMDSRFHDELHDVFGTRNVELPKVFIGGRYVGGAEEIEKLHESEELRKMVGELPPSDGRFSENCELCKGWRFVLCESCKGSHKIFSEESGFVSCTVCTVQGLVRCSPCFPVHLRQNSDVSYPVDLK